MRGFLQPNDRAGLFHQAIFRVEDIDGQTCHIAMLTVEPLPSRLMRGSGNLCLTKNRAPFIGSLSDKYQFHFFGQNISPFFR